MPNEKTRKTPIRTCCTCGKQGNKNTLLRIVRTPEGQVLLDPTGREPGRGAYLCANASCFAKARKQRKLDKALKISLGEDDYDRLEREFACMLAEMTSEEGADR